MNAILGEQKYYVYQPVCQIGTQKKDAIAAILRKYRYSLLTFSPSFNAVTLARRLNAELRDINSYGRGYRVELHVHNTPLFIRFEFVFGKDSKQASAYMDLLPVKRLQNADGEAVQL